MTRCVVLALVVLGLPLQTIAAQTPSGAVPLDSMSPPPALAAPVTVHASRAALRVVISDVAQQANASIVFDPSLAAFNQLVTATMDRTPAAKAILRLLAGTGLQAMVTSGGSVVLTDTRKRDDERGLLGGTIRQQGMALGAVHVTLAGTRFETQTDAAGRFTFGAVPPGAYTLHAVRMGSAPVSRTIHVGSDDAPIAIEMIAAAVPV